MKAQSYIKSSFFNFQQIYNFDIYSFDNLSQYLFNDNNNSNNSQFNYDNNDKMIK